MRKVMVLLWFAFMPGGPALTAAAGEVQPIPAPARIAFKNTPYAFQTERDRSIGLADPASSSDRFAAGLLAKEIESAYGFSPTIGSLERGKTGIVTGPAERMKSYLEWYGMLDEAEGLGPEDYLLKVEEGTILVAGGGEAGTFYGIQTLRQMIRLLGRDLSLPGMEIRDGPDLDFRAVLLDLCSGPVPTLEHLEGIIETLAEFKCNGILLVLPLGAALFSEVPGPWVEAFPLTPADIDRLAGFAKNHHVRLMGGLRLLPDLPEAIDAGGPLQERLEDQDIAPMLEGMVARFDGPFFLLDTRSLLPGRRPVRWLGDLAGLLAKSRRQSLLFEDDPLWSDVRPAGAGTLVHPIEPPGSAPARGDHDGARLLCMDLGCSGRFFPDLEKARALFQPPAAPSDARDAAGWVLAVTGLEGPSLIGPAWFPLLIGAAAAWRRDPLDREEFERAVGPLLFECRGRDAMDAVNSLVEVSGIPEYGGFAEHLVWERAFAAVPGRMDPYLNRAARVHDLASRALAALEKARSGALLRTGLLDALELAALRTAYLAHKRAGMVKAAEAYARGRYDGALDTLSRLHAELKACRNRYETLWLKENRPWRLAGGLDGYRFLADQLEGMMAAVRAAQIAEGYGREVPLPAEAGLETGELARRRCLVEHLGPESGGFSSEPWAVLDFAQRMPIEIALAFTPSAEDAPFLEFALPREIARLVLPDSGAFFVPSGQGAGRARLAQLLRGDGGERLARIIAVPNEASGFLYFNGPVPESKITCSKMMDGAFRIDNGAMQLVLDPRTASIRSWRPSGNTLEFAWFTRGGENGLLDPRQEEGRAFERAELLSWGPLLIRFRFEMGEGLLRREMILDIPAGRPWVEIFNDPGVPSIWNHLHPRALRGDGAPALTWAFSGGVQGAPREERPSGFMEQEGAVYGTLRGGGMYVTLLTPGYPCRYRAFAGAGVPGLGCASERGVAHAVLLIEEERAAVDRIDRLAGSLSPLRPGVVRIGAVEDRP